MAKTLLLIDASAYIFRAFYALPAMNRPDGTPIGAVYGFTQMLMKLVADKAPDYTIVVLDKSRHTFRNEIYPDYKANRQDPPDDLIPQFPLIAPAAKALNLAVAAADGFEADDLIASYAKTAREEGMAVEIISSDKDLMQLVGDGITMFDPMKQKYIGVAEVKEKFGVLPNRVADVQALAGDTSDNVPGVPSIGVKTAASLIDEFGDLETLLDKADTIAQPKRRQVLTEFADQARLSKRLVILREDAPMPVALADSVQRDYDATVLRGFLADHGFKSLLRRLDSQTPTTSAVVSDYHLISDEKTLAEWLAHCTAHDYDSAGGQLAIHTFTTPEIVHGGGSTQAQVHGIALAYAAGKAGYIPIGGDYLTLGQVMTHLTPVLQADDIVKIGHDIKNCLHALAVSVTPVDDIMCLGFVLDAGKGIGYGLEALVGYHLGQDMLPSLPAADSETDSKPKSKTKPSVATLPPKLVGDYAAAQADMILRVWQVLKPRLVSSGKLRVYERLERPLIAVLADMEVAGIRVDAGRLAAMSDEFAGRIADLEKDIYGEVGREFLIASPKQLGEILFDEMGLPGGKKSAKTGAWSTDAEVLESLAADGVGIASTILAWRQLAKLKSTYTDALVASINPTTNRVHTRFAMAGAATGRLSSIDPNLQNIPTRTSEGRRIRAAFVAAPGMRLISADYSQIELRLVAHIADETSMLAAFHNGVDIHAQTAAEVFGIGLDDMSPEWRRRAKAINFGIIYGISAFGLGKQLQVPQAQAAEYITQYLTRFAGIKQYMAAMREAARSQGYVETLFGRRLAIQGTGNKDYTKRGFAERQAINAPIQGSAADIIKQAMVRMPQALAEAGCAARMLLQVHDELIFECPEAEAETAMGHIIRVMEGASLPHLTLKAPLVVDAAEGQAWDEVH